MTSTPIALGERLYTRTDFRPYLERRAIDIAQPDVSNFGTELTVGRYVYPSCVRCRIVAVSASCTNWLPTRRHMMSRWHLILRSDQLH